MTTSMGSEAMLVSYYRVSSNYLLTVLTGIRQIPTAYSWPYGHTIKFTANCTKDQFFDVTQINPT